MEQKRLIEIVKNMRAKKIAVIGDLMLDRYFWGSVSRVSPEAPVPVVELESESSSLGGAANVANNIRSLGAEAIPIGVIGDDRCGRTLKQQFEEKGFPGAGIFTDADRLTTQKSRVIAHNQHVVRVDRESKTEVSDAIAGRLLDYFKAIAGNLDAVVLEDYNKGLLTKALIEEISAVSMQNGLKITVDPKHAHFFCFQNVSVFKPNLKELEDALGLRLQTPDQIRSASLELKKRGLAENILVTLGANGMHLIDHNDQEHLIPTRAKKVHDVSGAGDTVIATLTASLAAGATVIDAAHLANFAAGVVVGEVGAVPITPGKLQKSITNYQVNNNG